VTSQLLGRTHHSEVESLTASGLPIHEMLQQIRLELRKSVGDEHALLFAEPNANPETGHIQWYASTEGTARRLNELVGEERQAAEARLAQLTSDILAHATRLRESNDPQDQQIAKTLSDALEIPREADIFMVGRQPVIAAWGHVRRGQEPERQILRTLAERVRPPEPLSPPRPPSPPPPRVVGPSPIPPAVPAAAVLASVPAVAVRERSWLGPFLWLVLVLLLLAVGHLLLRNCAVGVAGSVLLDFCPAPQAQEDLLRRQMLERRLAELQRQLEQRRNSCVAPPKADTHPAPVPSLKERFERVVGGSIGHLTVILGWDNRDTLRLEITCPDGHPCAWSGSAQNTESATVLVDNPVEGYFTSGSQRGRHKVTVYRAVDRAPLSPTTPFTVQLLIDGLVVRSESGNAGPERKEVFTFEFPFPGGTSPAQPPRKP